jgi:hypothetical protein
MFAVQHSVLMAVHEDRLREVERYARARRARNSGIVKRIRNALGLSPGRAIASRPAPCPVKTPRTMIMAMATTAGYADAGRQN